MKKLVVLLLASLIASSAFAVVDPDPNSLGIYFDTDAENNCWTTAASVPFFTYLILANPTAPAINAYELGMTVEVPAGMEAMVFRLASTIADGVVSGVDVGENSALGGDYIVGLAAPLPASEAVVLHSWQYMVLAVFPLQMYIGSSSVPSIEGDYPVVQNAEGSILMQTGLSTGGPDIPVATVNDECVVGTEDVSFGSVKSLFR